MFSRSPLTYILALLFTLLVFNNLILITEQQFVLLAKSFKAGSLAFTSLENLSNSSLFNNQYYWPLGPVPALLILPFLYISNHFYQGFLSAPLSFLNFFLLYKLAKHLDVDQKRSLLLATFFIFGSIYFPLASLPASWYFAQVVACSLLILAIYEFKIRRGFTLTGIYLALAIATRFTLICSIPFFLYLIFIEKSRSINYLKLVTPIAISVAMLALYNNLRFNSPFEHGYNYQLIPTDAEIRKSEGLFSIKHIPANIYYLLLNGPEPVVRDNSHELKPPIITFDSYGLSIFFLSPVLFLAFVANFKPHLSRASLLAIGLTLIPLLTYYGIGHKQVGFRYALDFFPFVFIILADAIRKINLKLLTLLVFWGVFFAFYFTYLYMFGFEH